MQKIFRGAGVYTPLFSLRTKKSTGIGDFGDLKVLIDWCFCAGFKVIQLLPLNDTSITMTWKDSYPYSLLSVVALHPIYLNLEELPNIDLEISKQIEEARQQLPQLQVDYEAVLKLKLKIARLIFENEYNNLTHNHSFQNFINKSCAWLKSYAIFCFLRDRYKTCDTTEWEEGSKYNSELIEMYTNPSHHFYKEISFYFYLQFYLHKQLSEAAEYAHKKQVSLKGDFTVGVHKNSVETWEDEKYFRVENSLGAPPDFYSDLGQNWGFPGYNFEIMKKDHYKWFKKRLDHLSQYFSIMRIDHILGYFRFWEIGKGFQSGLLGHFNPAIPIKEDELIEKGIIDLTRLIKPIVTESFILENGKKEYLDLYFEPFSSFLYTLKPEINTEEKIDKLSLEQHVKDFLKQCAGNVILLKGDTKGEFHPSISLHKSLSYKNLESEHQKAISEIYHDYFFVRQEELWTTHAEEILTFFKQISSMTLCAEDLGFVPACVEPLLTKLSLLSLYIQRMPKKSGEEFANTEDYEELSVCSPSNHDTSTLREWWEEDYQRSQRYYTTILKQCGEAPLTLEPWIAEKIIFNHLNSKSTWSIFLLQDLFATSSEIPKTKPSEERINNPFNPHHYWRYRHPVYIEDLIENKSFTNKLKELIKKTSRH